MKLIFIDETEVEINKEKFFAVGGICIDIKFYHLLRIKFDLFFDKFGWDKTIEFKGRYLFSKKGDSKIDIEDRKEFIKNICLLSKSDKNARIKLLYSSEKCDKNVKNYKRLLSQALKQLKAPSESGHKSLLGVFIDYDSSLDRAELSDLVQQSINSKWKILERPMLVNSDNTTMGLLLADILLYLKINVENGRDQATKFDIKLKQFQYMDELINAVKKL